MYLCHARVHLTRLRSEQESHAHKKTSCNQIYHTRGVPGVVGPEHLLRVSINMWHVGTQLVASIHSMLQIFTHLVASIRSLLQIFTLVADEKNWSQYSMFVLFGFNI